MGSVLDLTVYQLCSFGQVFQTLFLCFMFFFFPQKDFFLTTCIRGEEYMHTVQLPVKAGRGDLS